MTQFHSKCKTHIQKKKELKCEKEENQNHDWEFTFTGAEEGENLKKQREQKNTERVWERELSVGLWSLGSEIFIFVHEN